MEDVIVVASSCGMRKAAGQLNNLVHVAPVKHLASLASGWQAPWAGNLAVLPLPGLTLGDDDEPTAANLARIGLCVTDNLAPTSRVGSVSLAGMQALKYRLATYFTRAPLAQSLFTVGAHEEWHEIDLWERWVAARGGEGGFQEWLDGVNPNFPARTRRETLYDDLDGVRHQLVEAIAGR
jgi:hypothetical protein